MECLPRTWHSVLKQREVEKIVLLPSQSQSQYSLQPYRLLPITATSTKMVCFLTGKLKLWGIYDLLTWKVLRYALSCCLLSCCTISTRGILKPLAFQLANPVEFKISVYRIRARLEILGFSRWPHKSAHSTSRCSTEFECTSSATSEWLHPKYLDLISSSQVSIRWLWKN